MTGWFLSRLKRLLGRAPRCHGADAEPSMAEGLRVYAVGDIHGELRVLDRLLARIAEDIERSGAAERRPLLVFLGDYVDRGADSCGTLDRLCAGPLPGVESRFLAGNHEAAMLDFLADPAGNAAWLDFGGAQTLASYGIRASVGVTDRARCRSLRDQLAERLPETHRDFLAELETCVVLGDYAFVHAGIRPGRPLSRQSREDLLWIREPFLSSPLRHEKIIVHGHTIVDHPEIHPSRIAIDTGAYATGTLSALVLAGTGRHFLRA